MTEADKIAQFLAQKGARVIEAGVSTIDSKTMYKAVRGENDLINERRLAATDHLGREYWVNELGERIS